MDLKISFIRMIRRQNRTWRRKRKVTQ